MGLGKKVLLSLLTTGISLGVSTASAQDAALAEARATETEACLRPLLTRFQITLSLMQEMRSQLRSADAAARADAGRAVRSLEQRIRTLGEAISACVPEDATLAPVEPQGARSSSSVRVGEPNAATEIIEQDRAISATIRVVVGERVDGRGSANADDVRYAFQQTTPAIRQCYESFLVRGSLQPMTAIIAFSVQNGSRSVTRVVVEGGPGGDFNRCLRRAARPMQVNHGATGGDARYAYTLHFGSDHQ